MFKVLDFQYDGKSSADFEMKIVNFSGTGVSNTPLGIPYVIEEQKIKRNAKPCFFGVEATPKLTFPLQIAYIPENGKNQNQNILGRGELGAIFKWLLRTEYHEFKIIVFF